MIRRLVNPPFSGSRLVSRPFWARVGRVLLFTTALGISPYLPVLFVDDLTEPQYTIALVASLYPALMVIWGFWKGHLVLGWLLLWIQLSFFLFWVVYLGVRSPVPPISYATLPALLGDLLLSLVGFELIVLLTVGLVFWRWDAKWARRVWQTSPDRQSARPSATTTKRPVALLGGAGAVLLFSLGWLLVALYPVQSLGDAFNDLLAASLQQEVLVAFHMVSVAILAALLIYGLWRLHSDIVEAGCWLLLPGQLMTAAWSWHQVLLMTSALALLLLGLLAQRHQGFPLSLRHSRRHVG